MLVGYKHVVLWSTFNLEAEIVKAWAVVTGRNSFFDVLDFDAVQSWLEIKGFEPFFAGSFEMEMNSLDDAVSCDVAFYAVPNKVWRTSRIISVDESTSE